MYLCVCASTTVCLYRFTVCLCVCLCVYIGEGVCLFVSVLACACVVRVDTYQIYRLLRAQSRAMVTQVDTDLVHKQIYFDT